MPDFGRRRRACTEIRNEEVQERCHLVLKRRHNMKGKNIIPIVRKMKATGRVTSFARIKSTTSMEDMSRGELISAFRELTGEDEKEILDMAQKEATEANLRHLLHYTILQANEVGQPASQTLQRLETEDAVNEERNDEVPQTKKAKVSSASATTTQTTEKEVEAIKEKVTVMCSPVLPNWEQDIQFCLDQELDDIRQKPTWVKLGERNPSLAAQRELAEIQLRDPVHFVSGQLHESATHWDNLLKNCTTDQSTLVSNWLKDGVDIHPFFRVFKGNFKGQSFSSEKPLKQYFQNSSHCKNFVPFIKSQLLEKIKNGSLRVIGKLGQCELPHIVMPLTIEPSKPRLCHDERYLNLWIKDNPFQLETLKHAHRLIQSKDEMFCCDEKSGYDHVRLHCNSQTYFGVQFAGWVFVHTTLPFGWKASPFIYQTIGMQVTNYFRNLRIATLQYIDDRFFVCPRDGENDQVIQTVVIVLETLSRLGYTLALDKCQLLPSTKVKYLGFVIDSERQAYILPEQKLASFISLREKILNADIVDLTTLQRFAGKCISMNLAIPAANLYTREVNHAISKCQKNSKAIQRDEFLREEIEHWRFLDNWEGCVRWRSEKHDQLYLATDASSFRYGVTVLSGNLKGVAFGDFWEEGDNRPIHLKEAEALRKAVWSLGLAIKNHRLDILTDNKAVLYSWQNQGSRNRELNCIMKQIFQYVFEHNIELNLEYVPSKENLADEPSRLVDVQDTMLSRDTWGKVEYLYGPHTVDLMACDSNAMLDGVGQPLRHFTRHPSPRSAGVNVFAQDIYSEENPYVFPPFALIFPILKLLKEQRVRVCTFIVPKFQPTPLWEAFLQRYAKHSVCIGVKGSVNVLRFPSKKGYSLNSEGLKWDLYAHRLTFS